MKSILNQHVCFRALCLLVILATLLPASVWTETKQKQTFDKAFHAYEDINKQLKSRMKTQSSQKDQDELKRLLLEKERRKEELYDAVKRVAEDFEQKDRQYNALKRERSTLERKQKNSDVARRQLDEAKRREQQAEKDRNKARDVADYVKKQLESLVKKGWWQRNYNKVLSVAGGGAALAALGGLAKLGYDQYNSGDKPIVNESDPDKVPRETSQPVETHWTITTEWIQSTLDASFPWWVLVVVAFAIVAAVISLVWLYNRPVSQVAQKLPSTEATNHKTKQSGHRKKRSKHIRRTSPDKISSTDSKAVD